MAKEILFICTGNYYRSRFAEALFNYGAEMRGLPWKAFSRGLAIHLADGPISQYTKAALQARKIPLHHTAPDRQSLTEADLERATRVFALKRTEHRPMMEAQFPAWRDRIDYWEVDDIDFISPEEALPQIAAHIEELLNSCK